MLIFKNTYGYQPVLYNIDDLMPGYSQEQIRLMKVWKEYFIDKTYRIVPTADEVSAGSILSYTGQKYVLADNQTAETSKNLVMAINDAVNGIVQIIDCGSVDIGTDEYNGQVVYLGTNGTYTTEMPSSQGVIIKRIGYIEGSMLIFRQDYDITQLHYLSTWFPLDQKQISAWKDYICDKVSRTVETSVSVRAGTLLSYDTDGYYPANNSAENMCHNLVLTITGSNDGQVTVIDNGLYTQKNYYNNKLTMVNGLLKRQQKVLLNPLDI